MCKFFCIPTQPCFCSPRIDRLILKTKAYSCSFLPGFISIWLMPPYFPLFAIPIQNVLPRWLMVCVTMPDGSPEIFCYSSFPTFLILNFLFLLRKCFAGCRVFRIIVLPLVQWCYAKCALTFTISGDISIEEHRKLNAKLFFFSSSGLTQRYLRKWLWLAHLLPSPSWSHLFSTPHLSNPLMLLKLWIFVQANAYWVSSIRSWWCSY